MLWLHYHSKYIELDQRQQYKNSPIELDQNHPLTGRYDQRTEVIRINKFAFDLI